MQHVIIFYTRFQVCLIIVSTLLLMSPKIHLVPILFWGCLQPLFMKLGNPINKWYFFPKVTYKRGERIRNCTLNISISGKKMNNVHSQTPGSEGESIWIFSQSWPTILVCLGLRGFWGHGIFSAKMGKSPANQDELVISSLLS